ncbi:hypothetical protein GGI12_005463 [Dipsacomyces acuminosporus]|nr:hypothetical protein GGI12_005463 [Dipsacomyces acuminosporus]
MWVAATRIGANAPKGLGRFTDILASQSVRSLTTGKDQGVAAPAAETKKPVLSKKQILEERKQIRKHLRKLVPHFEEVGSRRTEVLKPSNMLDHESSNITLETMMAAGMHLGHSASLWNPLNLPHIFGERQGVHIINLEHTMAALRRAAQFVKSVAYHGGIILFVGTRKDQQQLAVDAALHSNQYFVTGKWVPGTLTNPQSLLGKHLLYMQEVWDVEEAKDFANYKPGSASLGSPAGKGKGKGKGSKAQGEGRTRYMKLLEEEKAKLKADSDSVKTYKPDLIIALNPLESKTMLAESRLTHVPTVGIVDTNCDPRLVTYGIPCNDDSVRAVSIVAGVLGRAARAGMGLRKQRLTQAVEKHNQIAIEKAANDASSTLAVPAV